MSTFNKNTYRSWPSCGLVVVPSRLWWWGKQPMEQLRWLPDDFGFSTGRWFSNPSSHQLPWQYRHRFSLGTVLWTQKEYYINSVVTRSGNIAGILIHHVLTAHRQCTVPATTLHKIEYEKNRGKKNTHQTQWTDFRGQWWGGTNFSADSTEVHYTRSN